MNIGIEQTETFWQYFEELVDLELYQHKFLKSNFIEAQNGNQTLYDRSFINIQGNSWILLLELDSIHIYGHNWSNNQIEEFLERMSYEMFREGFVKGDTNLILDIFNRSNISNFNIVIERSFYRITELQHPTFDRADSIRLACMEDVSILANYLKIFYHEEYEGHNDKQTEEMERRMCHSICHNEVFVLLKEENEIVSFCTINNPDIGILFTHPNFRKKGYGKKILAYCTHKLLEANSISYLMTMRNKTESNSTSLSIGYHPYFQFSCFQMISYKN